jgi:uncharacterized protein YecT (DUF1311 family)
MVFTSFTGIIHATTGSVLRPPCLSLKRQVEGSRMDATAKFLPRLLSVLMLAPTLSCSPGHARSPNAETAGATLPAAVLGRWQVNGVLVDLGTTRTLRYDIDDPRLVGRLLTIGNGSIEIDGPETPACVGPQATDLPIGIDELIRKTMPRLGLPRGFPTAKDYNLPVDGGATAHAIVVTCHSGDLGPGSEPISEIDAHKRTALAGDWMLPMSGGRLAVRWFDETILILSPVDSNAQPNPSFDCKKAGTATERAICSSLTLASLDRSVALSFENNRIQMKKEADDESLKELVARQRVWLAKRNACGATSTCLSQNMWKRLEELANPD